MMSLAQIFFSQGDLVRSTNELYKSYGVGYIQKVRGEQAKVEFNPSVFMQPPYRSENKILHLKELERVDSPLDRAARGEWDEPWRFELKMAAARFLTQQRRPAFQRTNRNPAASDLRCASRSLKSKAAILVGR